MICNETLADIARTYNVSLTTVGWTWLTMPTSNAPSISPFYLIVADHDRGVFSVEGP